MIRFPLRRKKPNTESELAELLYISQLNILALANLTLTIIHDPECVTDETRDLMIAYVKDLEYGIANMEEFRV